MWYLRIFIQYNHSMVQAEGYVAAVAATDEAAADGAAFLESNDGSSPAGRILDSTNGVLGLPPEMVVLRPVGPLIPTLDKGTLTVRGSGPYM